MLLVFLMLHTLNPLLDKATPLSFMIWQNLNVLESDESTAGVISFWTKTQYKKRTKGEVGQGSKSE